MSTLRKSAIALKPCSYTPDPAPRAPCGPLLQIHTFRGLSVGTYVEHTSEACENGKTDRDAIDSCGPVKPLDAGVHWRRLTNTTDLSMCGSDAALRHARLSISKYVTDQNRSRNRIKSSSNFESAGCVCRCPYTPRPKKSNYAAAVNMARVSFT